MSARGAGTAALVVTLVLVAVGCGASGSRARVPSASTPDAAPSPAQTAATRALKALQASVADLGAVEISGGTTGSPLVGRRKGTSNLRTGDFSASITMDKGLSVTMRRHMDLTWTMAPPVYWTGIGYTKASARAARGKWVVGPAASVAPMIDAMDPGALIRTVLGLTGSNLRSVALVTKGALRGNRVLIFSGAGTSQRIYFTASDRPQLTRLTSTKDGATTWVDFVAFPKTFQVRVPRARDVLGGQ